MLRFTDQMGRTISLLHPAQRIVSLVPSQTELLHHLGLEAQVVGITKFCIHPAAWFRSKPRIGGTKNVHLDAVRQLKPDLILANKEENVQEQVEALAKAFPVWLSDVNDLPSACAMIEAVGLMTGTKEKAQALTAGITKAFAALCTQQPIPVCYLIWKEPYYTVGGDTFINDLLHRAGFCNVFAHLSRYPEVSLQQIAESDCALVFLSSEPYPFGPKHREAIATGLPGKIVLLCDGEFFSWYGSRLLTAPAYFQHLRKVAAEQIAAHS